MKISRPQYGLEEEIVEAIYALREKKSSDIFREPVDGKRVPDYYDKIKNPMDLSTIIKKLKEGSYSYAREVHDDLQLIVNNCIAYNVVNSILKKAEQFRDCIKTVWGNFKRQIEKKGISYDQPIKMNEEILRRINMIEEKKNRKRVPALQTVIEQDKKNILPQVSVLPPIEYDFEKPQREELPPEYEFNPDDYITMDRDTKRSLLNFTLDAEQISTDFEQVAEKKLKKYRKILKKRILWFDQKIIQKCLVKKRFKKMQVPNHLNALSQNGEIAEELNIRKLQMYVKQITYWVEDNSSILSDYMKDKFVENCRAMKKCLIRVIKYKRVPKQKSQFDLYGAEALPNLEEGEPPQANLQKQEDNYDNKMKEFKRMLERDRAQSTKRDTKIVLRNENGEMQVIDWISDRKQDRGTRKEGGGARMEPPDNDERKKMEEMKKDEIRRDQEFIDDYSKKSNVLLIGKYGNKLSINWEQVFFTQHQLPKQINFNYTDDDL